MALIVLVAASGGMSGEPHPSPKGRVAAIGSLMRTPSPGGSSHFSSSERKSRLLTINFLLTYVCLNSLQYWSLELGRKGLLNIHKGIALRNQGPSCFSWYYFYVSIDDIFLGLYHHCPPHPQDYVKALRD